MSTQKRPRRVIIAALIVLALIVVAVFTVRSLLDADPTPGPTVTNGPPASDGGADPRPVEPEGDEEGEEPGESAEPGGPLVEVADVDTSDVDAVAAAAAQWLLAPGVSGDEIVETVQPLTSVESIWGLRGIDDAQVPSATGVSVHGGGSVNAGELFVDWETYEYTAIGTMDGEESMLMTLWVGRPLLMAPDGSWDDGVPYRVIGAQYADQTDETPALASPYDLTVGAQAASSSLLTLVDPLLYEDPQGREEAIIEAFSHPDSALTLEPLVSPDRGSSTRATIQSIYWNTYPGDDRPSLMAEGVYTDLALGSGGLFRYRIVMDIDPQGGQMFTVRDAIDDDADPRPLPELDNEEDPQW